MALGVTKMEVVWHPYEIALTSLIAYAPQTAWRGSTVQLNATFTLGSTVLETPGFWNGGQHWRVRFAAPTPGQWTYRTSCSDAKNTGLHGQTGGFTIAPYGGSNPLYAHGFLRPNAGGRYLEHADGTPFYWLGDTHWSGFSTAEHWGDSDNTTVDPSQPTSMLKAMVDVRAAQGYSVWKGETFVINGQQGGAKGGIANAGGDAWGAGGMYGELRPEFWAAIDEIIAYINSKGLVVSFAFAGIGRGLTNQSQVLPITDLARYATARYAGYSTVWTTCQEYCSQLGYPDAIAAWGEIAASQFALDPHNRSTSLHNCAANPIPAWRSAAWYGHNTNQQGHFTTASVDHWLEQYDTIPPKVLIEDEANYEQLKYAGMTTNVPGWLTRQSAWQSQIAGAAGYTYGGQGIWWACYNRSYVSGNCGPNDPPGLSRNESGYFTWDETLTFPVGGHQLPLMAAFFRSLPWHTLEPNAAAVAWDSPAAPTNTQKPFQKADAAGHYIVAYLPQANGDPHSAEGPPGTPPVGCRPPLTPGNHSAAGRFGGTASINPGAPHTASWFDPRSGATTLIAALPKGTTSWRVPASRPGGGTEAWRDWVLLIEPRSSSSSSSSVVRGAPAPAPAPVGGDISWVTSVSAKGKMRLPPAEVGCTFVATQMMSVTQLCRLPVANITHNIETVSIFGENGSHVASAHVDALGATRDEHGFVCTSISSSSTTVVLEVGNTYFLTLTSRCDSWHDDTGTMIDVVGGDSAQVTSFYGVPPNVKFGGGGKRHCYGPLNFHFTVANRTQYS